MSELEGVKQEIAEVKRDLEEAKKNGFPIDNVGVVALNNRLTELQKKENLLLSSRDETESILVKALKSNTKVMSRVSDILEDIGDKDGYDRISEGSKPRALSKDDYEKTYKVPKKDLKCMISGHSFPHWNVTTQGNHPITLAHLLPRSADAKERLSLGYGKGDIENIRNTILLCKGFEEAFDHKFISFVPSDCPFSNNRYKLQIWVDKVRGYPIFEGSSETIGAYDQYPLILTVGTHSHDPFKRALSYQTFRSFKTWAKELGLTELPEDCDLSAYDGSYKKKRIEYAKQLAKDIEAEVSEEEDNLA